ncbi:MAG TPA: caspase family protein [Bacteroidales bacterium]|nr:caspase family protein [Bacteroidales bacterium]HPB25921.1 caspase family protein [Bacteroidales bacterium]HPI31125.1 caspase family protein [Bacteroidales bacterium]HQN15131.1 caspase family protein [Bacteroidales bacterium]HQP14865.1 caspase family protein [Bacteroidales bacterium]
MKKLFLLILIIIQWPLIVFCQSPELVLPTGHSDGILHAAYSKNGKYIMTASMDKTARIWDAYSGKLLSVLYGHTDYVNRIQSTDDSRLVITASNDNTIKVWTLPQGILKYDFKCESCFSGVLGSDPQNNALVIATGKGNLAVYNLKTGLLVKELKCHDKRIRRIVFSPDSKTLLTAAYDEKFVKAINIENGSVLFEINYQEWEPEFDFINSGNEILVKGDQGRVYNALTGTFLRMDENYKKSQEPMEAFSPDNRYYVYYGIPEASNFQNFASVHDTKTGRELRLLTGRVPEITDIQLSTDKNFLASLHDDKSARVWNITNGTPAAVLLEDSVWRPEVWGGAAAFFRDGKKLVTVFYDSCKATVWEVNSQSLVHTTPAVDDELLRNFDLHFTNCAFNEDSSKLLISNWGCVSVIDAKTYKQLFQKSEVHLSSAEWTDHGKKLVIKYIGLEPEVWCAEKWVLLHRFNNEMKDEGGYIENFRVCKNGKQGVSLSSSKKVGLWDINSWRLVYSTPDSHTLTFVDYNEAHNYIITIDTGHNIQLIDPESGKYIRTFSGHQGIAYTIEFSNDGSEMMSFSEDAKEVILWNVATGEMINRISPSERPHCFFCYEDKYFAHNQLEILCYEKKQHEIKFRMAAIQDHGYVCLLKNGKYRCSRDALKYLAWKVNDRIYGFDQWDVIYNRPDEVMKALGSSEDNFIQAYYQAFLKRLKKMNADSSANQIGKDYPEIIVFNADAVQGMSKDSLINLEIRAVDKSDKGFLTKIVVMVNNCPIGDPDKKLSFTEKQKDVRVTVPVSLSYGENTIEVFSLNSRNNSSLKQRMLIDYLPAKKPKSVKHLIIISVSAYQDTKYNLKYAVKDGRDMAALFGGRGAVVDTLFDQNATRPDILALKQKLLQTGVDDEVVLYVSGHGLLDKNYDFYFAAYDMDFADPAKRGVLYDDLEALLDGIPARKKLLLMDACHSGEVDKEQLSVNVPVTNPGNNKRGDIKTYGYKGATIEEEGSGLGLQNSFELMQELFANLSAGSGAVVISAAAGTGYALESPEWNNGVFTYCILNGLKNLAADASGDKIVSVSELKDYVSKEVERLTNGAQRPTSRKESLEFDWKLW